jgi:thiamine biosynthesis lipoprotein
VLEADTRVMGTIAHVVVVGEHDTHERALAEAAVQRLFDLEQRWTRFHADSEVSRLNAHAGRPVLVSVETWQLVAHAVECWRRTHGLFDPTTGPALCAAGYDRDFSDVAARSGRVTAGPAAPAPGCADIVLDDVVLTVTLPLAVEFDAGGIGKGLAADLVFESLREAGARGALVNVGGDLRAGGEPPNGATWEVDVASPAVLGNDAFRISLLEGAVATSSRTERRWHTSDGRAMHHLIDPRTGRPAARGPATVAAVAGEAWWAEAIAKAVLIGDLGCAAGVDFDAAVVTIDDDGSITADPRLSLAS